MPHPVTQPEILAALESNAQTIVEFFSSVPERLMFEGDPEHWSPAHHLAHLSQANGSVEKALRSSSLPLHPTAQSRPYAELRDAAASSLAATPKDRLREMGRKVVIAPGTGAADVIHAFATSSARVRSAASAWSEEALDQYAMVHPIMGELTVREMLLFFVFHERHHLKSVRSRLEAKPG